jgi:hypothetical protein
MRLSVGSDTIVPGRDDGTPDDTWDVERLTDYATEHLEEAILMGRRAAVAFHRAGRALRLIREKEKRGHNWMAWQKQNGLKKTTVNDAIRFFVKQPDEQAVAGLGITDALARYGIRPRPEAGNTSRKSARPGDASGTSYRRRQYSEDKPEENEEPEEGAGKPDENEEGQPAGGKCGGRVPTREVDTRRDESRQKALTPWYHLAAGESSIEKAEEMLDVYEITPKTRSVMGRHLERIDVLVQAIRETVGE